MITLITYLDLLLILACGCGVVLARDPIQSVLFLVTVFILTAILLFVMGAEFLAILLITVYVGAIAILFLFVVMLLNLRMVEAYNSLYYQIPVGGFIALSFIALAYILFSHNQQILIAGYMDFDNYQISNTWTNYLMLTSNLTLIGEVLYNYYIDLFIVIGLILFASMIGVIVLTVDYDYRTTYAHIENSSATNRVNLQGIVWENINIYTKIRQHPWHSRNQAGLLAEPYLQQLTEKKNWDLPLPNWMKRLLKDIL